jgi:hypothetical protein
VATANDLLRKKEIKVQEMSIRLYMLTEVKVWHRNYFRV